MGAAQPSSPETPFARGTLPHCRAARVVLQSLILATAFMLCVTQPGLAGTSRAARAGGEGGPVARPAPDRPEAEVLQVKAHRGVDPERLRSFVTERAKLLEEMGARVGLRLPASQLPSYELYTDLVQKGTLTGSSEPVDAPDPGGRIRRVLALPCAARDGEAEAAWLMQMGWEVKPLPLWSVGLAAHHAPKLYGRSAGALAGALAHSGYFPSLEELLESPRELRQYPTLFAPAAAVLVGWILDVQGPRGLEKAVIATSRGADRLPALAAALKMDPAGVRRAYATVLGERAERHPRAHAREHVDAPSGRQRGICYAHTVSLQRGYASHRAARQLDRLQTLGANWVSVTPFGYLKLHSPQITASSGFGSEGETDESMGVVITEARARGLGVMVKPHLWSNGFVGQISMRTAEDWRRFFKEYGRYILHHAILAEACDGSALSVGNELIECTRGHDREWRRLIRAVRSIFAGSVTYGAHWREEVERIGFWDALDWVGVSLYAPLAEDGKARSEDLRESARRQAERLRTISRRVDRPLLLVEVGFPSHPRAPFAPWEDPEHGPADPGAQAEAYEALLSVFWPLPFVEGVYWWKWFSDEPGPPGDRSHRFAGKPAEEIVRRFYRMH